MSSRPPNHASKRRDPTMHWIVRSSRALAAAAAFSVLVADVVGAQGVTTGAITGRVTDQQGQPLVDVDVEVVNRSTGYASSTRTRATGLFLVQGLEVGGPYSVRVRAIGYERFVRDDIYVRLSQATHVDAQLSAQPVELAPITLTVGRPADFTPPRQGVAVQISDTLVRRVPTFSRDFIDLLKLAPQVVYGASGAASGAGAYNRYNTVTIDGANQSERFNLSASGGVPGGGANGKIVSLDAVKEFRVMFTPSDVRQGNFAGMLVNAVTKNGTNEFHGGASYTYRSNQDVAGFDLVGQDLRASKFDVKQYGFYVGGPIIRDRLHFFIAPEFQHRTQPSTGPYYLNGQPSPSPAPAVELDSLNSIADTMKLKYGFDVGSAGPIDIGNPLTNLFGRVDFQISPTHRVVLREMINHADLDNFSRNIGNYQTSPLNQNSGFRFGSNEFTTVSRNTSTGLQLYSNLPGGKSNEFIFGYTTIKDQRNVPVTAPEVGVGVNDGGTVRAVTLGTEQFSPNNLLKQTIIEFVDNFTIPAGANTITLGGRFDHTHIFNNFAQGTFGVYNFPTIAALGAGTPNGYAIGYANSRNDSDIPADFHVQVYSLYAQDQWAATDRLTLTAGLRVDIPRLLDKPSQNDTLTNALAAAGLPDVRTGVAPKTMPLVSPRLGFNFDATGDNRNQIRGSVGIYTGPPPYILLGNAYANTGLGLVRLSCTDAATPAFTLNVSQLPTACAGQQAPAAGQAGTVGVNINDRNFKFPQYFGVSAGFDRQLPFNTVLTVEGLYRKAINGVLIRDANIKGPRMVGGQPYTDRDGRVLYADTMVNITTPSPAVAVTNTNQRWITTPRRLVAYGTYSLPWAGTTTDITLYYERTSGVPFTYVANGDLNGDLYVGNDPIYVPRDATDPAEIQIGTGVNGAFVQNAAAAQAFNRFISAQPCLDKQRGHIMERNSCRTPTQNRLDVSLRQSLPSYRGHELALQLDFFNFLNFLSKDWGQIRLPTLSPTFNDQRALTVTGLNSGPLSQSISTFTFDNKLYDTTTGDPKPFEGRTGSVYQIQP